MDVPVHGLAVEWEETAHGFEGVAVHVHVHFFHVGLEFALEHLDSFGDLGGGGVGILEGGRV